MFTGLIEAVGRVISIEASGEQARLTIGMPFARDLALGDSVAVNGCCLTVAKLHADGARFDLLARTLQVTSLGSLTTGSKVNLERAMRADGRFGGHFVQGHVDATGTIASIEANGQDHIVKVTLPPEVRRFCIDKGSIAVDGISLTLAAIENDVAVFWITPHTWMHTHLHEAKVGQHVNLEADLLAKHVDALLTARAGAS